MLTAQASPHRALLALIAGQICLHSAMSGLRMAGPLMMLRQGEGVAGLPAEAMAGLLLGLFAVAPVATALPAGRWADRRGYHRPVRLAIVLVLMGAALALPGTWLIGWTQALLLALGALCCGAGSNLGLIAIQRSAGRLVDAAVSVQADPQARSAELKRVFSWVGMAPPFSNVLGPVLAGVLIDAGGFALAFGALAALPLGTAWCSRRVPAELTAGSAALAASPGQAVQARPPRRPARELLAVPGMRPLLLMNWFFSTSWDLHTFLVPVLGHERGLSASAIGLVLGVFSAAVTAVRLAVPLLARHLSEGHTLRGAMVTAAAVFVVYPWATTAPQMAACALVLGLALGSAQPMILTTLHHLAPPDRQGEAIALRSAVINLSSTLLPLGFGVLGASVGTPVLFRAMAVLLVAGLRLPARVIADASAGRPPTA
jgi:MFS family permease